MNEDQNNKTRRTKRYFSLEEKRNYCETWKKSGAGAKDFCKANGISSSAFYQWNREFKEENPISDFSPLILEKSPAVNQADKIHVSVQFPNQLLLNMELPENHLISFIQELGYATAVVR